MLEQVSAGRGGGVCIRGEPGVGKSALLWFAEEQAADARVLRTECVTLEGEFAYAALHRLLLPISGLVTRLPDPQRRALDVAFGQRDGPVPDRFLVALATLSLLSEAAVAGTVLCLVDDAQWADPATLDVLAFVARRVINEPVAVVVATRAGDDAAGRFSGLIDVSLEGLDGAAAHEVLSQYDNGRLTVGQRSQVLTMAGGNPLALRELCEAVLHDGGLQDPRPLTAGLQRAFLDRVRRQNEETQRVLLLIAADGWGRMETIYAAAAVLGLSVDPIKVAVADGFVTDDGARFIFAHPLIRAAVYHGAAHAERKMAHRALADALHDDPSELYRYAWHLGQATEGKDDWVADELERSASIAAQRAGHDAGAAALVRAAELSVSEVERRRRLVTAATAYCRSGDLDRARELLDQAGPVGQLSNGTRMEAAELRATLETRSGSPADALAHLRPVIPDVLRKSIRHAMSLLLLYSEVGYKANLPTAWAEIVDWIDTVALDGDTPEDALHRLLRGACRARAGKNPTLRPGDVDAAERLEDPIQLTQAAGLTWGLGEYETGRRLLRKAVQQARAIGAAGTLAWSLEYVVFDELARSRFSTAEAYAEEGYQLALETGQPNTACRHQSRLAWLAALQGRTADARRQAESVLAEASNRQLADCLAYAQLSLGHLDLVAGNNIEAVRHYESLHPTDASTMQSALVMHVVPELIEALTRARQHDRAADHLTHFTRWTTQTSSPQLQALAARCRALVADGADAEAEYRRALQLHAQTDAPLDFARTELLYGQHLRRARRRSDAQYHLRQALDTFRRIGARAWEERAADELRAAGGSQQPGDPTNLSTLTPQERRIALAVAEGATNREIAAQLFLSPRTVDYHLRKIFQQLGIHSRTELVRIALTDRAPKTSEHPTEQT